MVEVWRWICRLDGTLELRCQAGNSRRYQFKRGGRKHRSELIFFNPPGQVIVWTAGLQLSAWLWKALPPTQWSRGSSTSSLTRRMRPLRNRPVTSWAISVERRYVSTSEWEGNKVLGRKCLELVHIMNQECRWLRMLSTGQVHWVCVKLNMEKSPGGCEKLAEKFLTAYRLSHDVQLCFSQKLSLRQLCFSWIETWDSTQTEADKPPQGLETVRRKALTFCSDY